MEPHTVYSPTRQTLTTMTLTNHSSCTAQLKQSVTALLLLALTLFSAAAAAQGQLLATVDRAQISMEETLKLQVRYNEQVIFGEPDFAALQQNFDVLARTRSQQYHNVNGKTESWTQWVLTLAPQREGTLLIPSFEFKGSFSDAIEITVSKTAPSAVNEQPVYLETELDKNEGFVQEQFLYTIRLYTSVDLSGLDRGELKIKNALMKIVAENQYQRVINGVPFGVVETTYAVFPQQSGTLEIPSTLWSVGINSNRGYRYDPFLSQSGQQLRLRTPAKSIQVKPKPDNYQGEQWLPAQNITLEQSWSQPPEHFKIGEPITRTITIRAKALMGSQLPPLAVRETDGVKYYPDQPQTEESVSTDGVTTIKTESYAIVPSREGKITLPAITLRWWDTQAKRNQEATLPAHTIAVGSSAAAASNVAATPMPEPATDTAPIEASKTSTDDKFAERLLNTSSLWFYIAMGLLLTNLITLRLWQKAKAGQRQLRPITPTTAPAKSSEKQAYKALQKTLQQDDPQLIRAALLTWARLYENNPNLSSLQELAEALPPLATFVRQLEANLYSQEVAPLDTESLQRALQELRRHGYRGASPKTASSLPPLYAEETHR
jgi:hypothetical protein